MSIVGMEGGNEVEKVMVQRVDGVALELAESVGRFDPHLMIYGTLHTQKAPDEVPVSTSYSEWNCATWTPMLVDTTDVRETEQFETLSYQDLVLTAIEETAHDTPPSEDFVKTISGNRREDDTLRCEEVLNVAARYTVNSQTQTKAVNALKDTDPDLHLKIWSEKMETRSLLGARDKADEVEVTYPHRRLISLARNLSYRHRRKLFVHDETKLLPRMHRRFLKTRGSDRRIRNISQIKAAYDHGPKVVEIAKQPAVDLVTVSNVEEGGEDSRLSNSLITSLGLDYSGLTGTESTNVQHGSHIADSHDDGKPFLRDLNFVLIDIEEIRRKSLKQGRIHDERCSSLEKGITPCTSDNISWKEDVPTTEGDVSFERHELQYPGRVKPGATMFLFNDSSEAAGVALSPRSINLVTDSPTITTSNGLNQWIPSGGCTMTRDLRTDSNTVASPCSSICSSGPGTNVTNKVNSLDLSMTSRFEVSASTVDTLMELPAFWDDNTLNEPPSDEILVADHEVSTNLGSNVSSRNLLNKRKSKCISIPSDRPPTQGKHTSDGIGMREFEMRQCRVPTRTEGEDSTAEGQTRSDGSMVGQQTSRRLAEHCSSTPRGTEGDVLTLWTSVEQICSRRDCMLHALPGTEASETQAKHKEYVPRNGDEVQIQEMEKHNERVPYTAKDIFEVANNRNPFVEGSDRAATTFIHEQIPDMNLVPDGVPIESKSANPRAHLVGDSSIQGNEQGADTFIHGQIPDMNLVPDGVPIESKSEHPRAHLVGEEQHPAKSCSLVELKELNSRLFSENLNIKEENSGLREEIRKCKESISTLKERVVYLSNELLSMSKESSSLHVLLSESRNREVGFIRDACEKLQ
ncbi:hypothetical protein MPTK1_2g15470 [Marchantia polymorpha subsp. ruderalis]|uniref:Uncharacterized protein n=1 Tax=Marchantia polymorpha TaxID=3197 RepID=A0A2R6WK08_MARPO|nr:hypothetical protein MARPO_0082s0045 [Marchantia polymorpha]BBN02449.1 hypothetical protein Mp_2g15470 [Marchantia polymorpha subsp. ruderalis]|eukprot:PTQ34198.1 hypothetical protein MARPO_0082s0045 [Marchantia polymorpha]